MKTYSTCSVTGLTAVAMDVAVPRTNIREDSNGNPVLSFYVQFSSSVFLSADTLAAAVMVSSCCSSVCKCYNYIIVESIDARFLSADTLDTAVKVDT